LPPGAEIVRLHVRCQTTTTLAGLKPEETSTSHKTGCFRSAVFFEIDTSRIGKTAARLNV
ncbi:MAG TPA: hypothetical protein VF396_00285, partial [Bradyrhizobium sp.]